MNKQEREHDLNNVLESIDPSLGRDELRSAYMSLRDAIQKIAHHAVEERRLQDELRQRAETAEHTASDLAARIRELEYELEIAKRFEEAYQEGRTARQHSKPESANPYDSQSNPELHSAWAKGWAEQDALEQIKRERNLATARVAAVQEILDERILSYLLAWLGLSAEVIYLDEEKLDELREWATKLDMIMKTDSQHRG